MTASAVSELGLVVDFEPDTPSMSHLVRESSRRCDDLLTKKRVASRTGVDTNAWRRIDMVWPADRAGSGDGRVGDDSVFARACRRQPTPYTPVWLMRQAGRYQREYRRMRANMT